MNKETDNWSSPFDVLRKKWCQVPAGNSRRLNSTDVLLLSDGDLVTLWKDARDHDTLGPGFQIRGWYHELYREFVKGKKILDVGSGLGFSTLTFAEWGAALTFTDIVKDNLMVLERLCSLFGIKANFVYLHDIESLKPLPTDFDVVTAIGSLINAPFEVTRNEVKEIVRHLRPGGRWLHFAYPKARWVREGSPPFDAWGEMTDGPGTPWMEFYDVDKMFRLFEPARVELLFEYEWHNKFQLG